MKYVIYIKPSEEITRIREQFLAYLGPQNYGVSSLEPHCTLMVGRFTEKNEKKVISKLERITIPHLSLTIEELALFDGLDPQYAALVARVTKTPDLQKLHLDIIKQLAPLLAHEEIPPLSPTYNERKKTWKTYSSPFVEKYYNPHITICDIEKNTDITSLPNKLAKLSWKTTSIHISKRKENGWEYVREFIR